MNVAVLRRTLVQLKNGNRVVLKMKLYQPYNF